MDETSQSSRNASKAFDGVHSDGVLDCELYEWYCYDRILCACCHANVVLL